MKFLLKSLVAPVAAFVLAIACSETAQALTFYGGQDAGVGPGVPRPNSDAAASTFEGDAATLGILNTVNFENLPLTEAQSLTIAPGVTATWFNQASFTIFNNPSVSLGYNTTPGGSQFARFAYNDFALPVGVTFSFATPIQAWAAYFTGSGTASGQTVIQFNDGTLQTQDVLGAINGGVSFLGFTAPGKQISSITVLQTPAIGPDGNPTPAAGDILGIDDLRYVPAVPTPTLIPGFVGLAMALLREKLKVKR